MNNTKTDFMATPILQFPSNILAIFAHADDEMNAAGTLMKNQDYGGTSKIICWDGGAENTHRQEEMAEAAKVLNIKYDLLKIPYPDYDKDYWERELDLVQRIISFKPDVIITHRGDDDYHVHHRYLYNIVKNAARKAAVPKDGWLTRGLLLTENHSLHQEYHVAVDITEYVEKIIEAQSKHKSQNVKNDNFYVDMISKKAEYRGFQTGCKFAEVFKFEPTPIVGNVFKNKKYAL
ncbi:hypothetical protein COV13_01190 [Candidatus Woesearchaeota archaeon CG10_big_fil_rev_8_21_14_0_10_32_9]|nr:MAG: hypothetical protein COV13_01190 [Candidatus Woesearchaeota archaeon CG10_big_fil_rev_8_21_14_0_10_32_9]